MKTFFQILKGFFFFFTILVGIFFLRGEIFFSTEIFTVLKICIMPGYLVMVGLMIGYLFASIQDKGIYNPKLYTKGFIVGIIAGILLALTYIFI